MLLSMSLSRIPRLLVCVIVLHQWSSVVKSQCVSPPTITEKLQTEIKFETDYHLLECAASGDPQPKFSWRARNTTNPLILNKSNQTLNISKTDGEGIYTCLATNDCGTALQEFHVIIPRLSPFDAVGTIIQDKDEGSWAVLTCNPPEGSPSPELFWTISDSGDDPAELSDRVNFDNRTGNLIFANVQPSDQSYYYRCNAKNSGRGRTFSDPIELKVQTRDSSSIENHGPTIVAHPEEHVEGLRGEKLRLECIATGRPTPNVTWSRLGDPIRSQVRHDSYGLALEFDALDFSDAGIYSCQAAIKGIQSAFHNVTLTVKSAPYWPEDWDPNVRIGPGESTAIQCPAGGVPNATITWLSNGDKIQNNNERVRVVEDMVVITHAMVEDTRVLQCIAENKYGQNFINVNLNTQPMPTEHVTAVTPGTNGPIASTEGKMRINVRMKRDVTTTQEPTTNGTGNDQTSTKPPTSAKPTVRITPTGNTGNSPTSTKPPSSTKPTATITPTGTIEVNCTSASMTNCTTAAVVNTTGVNITSLSMENSTTTIVNITDISVASTKPPSITPTETADISVASTKPPSITPTETAAETPTPSNSPSAVQKTSNTADTNKPTSPPSVVQDTSNTADTNKPTSPPSVVQDTSNTDTTPGNTPTKKQPPNKGTNEKTTTGDENTLLIIIIAVIALGFFVVVILVYVYRSQKSKSGSFKPSVVDSTENSPADEEGNVGLVPVPFQDQHIDKSSTIVEINSTKENNGITKAADDDAEKAKSPDSSGDKGDETSPDGEKDKADIASTQGPDAMETKTDKEGDAGADTKL